MEPASLERAILRYNVRRTLSYKVRPPVIHLNLFFKTYIGASG